MSALCKSLVSDYREARYRLCNYKNRIFPSGSVVYVDDFRYVGYGIVNFLEGNCPPNLLDVKVESGNAWRYPIESCRRSKRFADWPKWIREQKEKA